MRASWPGTPAFPAPTSSGPVSSFRRKARYSPRRRRQLPPSGHQTRRPGSCSGPPPYGAPSPPPSTCQARQGRKTPKPWTLPAGPCPPASPGTRGNPFPHAAGQTPSWQNSSVLQNSGNNCPAPPFPVPPAGAMLRRLRPAGPHSPQPLPHRV